MKIMGQKEYVVPSLKVVALKRQASLLQSSVEDKTPRIFGPIGWSPFDDFQQG